MAEVPVVTLDDVITEPVTLIKMDVEGFELRAIHGAEGGVFFFKAPQHTRVCKTPAHPGGKKGVFMGNF